MQSNAFMQKVLISRTGPAKYIALFIPIFICSFLPSSPEEEEGSDDGSIMSTEDVSALRDIDYILENFVGNSGPWQRRFLVLILTVFGATYLLIFLHLFAVYVPMHRCRVPICDGSENNFNESWVEDFAIPKDYVNKELVKSKQPFDPCHHYQVRT